MLRSMKEVNGYKLNALDDKLGKCKDFLFDDVTWTIRYMVADTGNWLVGRKVIIPPHSLDKPDWASQMFPVHLTKEEIKNAPDLVENAPVSRQYEEKFYQYFGWPYYWASAYAGGAVALSPEATADIGSADEPIENPHLRSFDEVRGYHVDTLDGKTGHIEDFVFDDTTWVIRYLVVDTRNWLPGRKVLVAPEWVSAFAWAENKVHVDLLSEQVEKSPRYDPSQPVNRRYEIQLYDYYGRPKWWNN